MISCVFTIDYEIYGNGQGSLHDLVFEPTRKLKAVFDRHGSKFVNFVEAAEFEQIERHGTDPASADVRRQIRELHQDGYETALHLHPQWANARREKGEWILDYDEYNLCVLPPLRIGQIIDRGIGYLRDVLGDPQFSPFSFRAGNWLFQPTRESAKALAARGIKLDSSVFKGGVQHVHNLDYRPALRNGHYWNFRDDVNVDVKDGPMLEIPIHVQMVPFWRMLTGKRVRLQKKSDSAAPKSPIRRKSNRFGRLRDYLRLTYPLKFDFCRMTLGEMTAMLDRAIEIDRTTSDVFKPLVAIGHTKDLVDFDAIDLFLSYLKRKDIVISTLEGVYPHCRS